MQWRYEEEQRLLVQLEEVAKLCRAEHAAQKARREAEEKAQKEAKRQRVAEEEERKRRMMEYFQRLQDEVLEEEAVLLEGAEGFQVMGSKRKEVSARDEKVQWPSKKARGKQLGKYRRGAAVKIQFSQTKLCWKSPK